jgi:hypothetical protein
MTKHPSRKAIQSDLFRRVGAHLMRHSLNAIASRSRSLLNVNVLIEPGVNSTLPSSGQFESNSRHA